MNTTKKEQKSAANNSSAQNFDYNAKLDEITLKISEIARSSCLGLIAVAWLGLSANKDSPKVVIGLDENWLMIGAGTALVALILDFFQYVFGYFAILGDKENRRKLIQPHRKSPLRRARFICFYGKIFAVAVSSFVLITAVSAAVLDFQLWL